MKILKKTWVRRKKKIMRKKKKKWWREGLAPVQWLHQAPAPHFCTNNRPPSNTEENLPDW